MIQNFCLSQLKTRRRPVKARFACSKLNKIAIVMQHEKCDYKNLTTNLVVFLLKTQPTDSWGKNKRSKQKKKLTLLKNLKIFFEYQRHVFFSVCFSYFFPNCQLAVFLVEKQLSLWSNFCNHIFRAASL